VSGYEQNCKGATLFYQNEPENYGSKSVTPL